MLMKTKQVHCLIICYEYVHIAEFENFDDMFYQIYQEDLFYRDNLNLSVIFHILLIKNISQHFYELN